jgi:nuclear GTP-binding protein
MTKRAKGGKS